nr:hypothetical protein [Tanacetum cinerariifolium]
MMIKPRVDTLSFDDLYNNIRVFESDVKGSTASSSNTQNVAFVSSDNTNITNEVSTTYGIPTSSGHNSQKEGSSSYTDDLISKENQESRWIDAGNTGYKARDSGRYEKQDEHKAMVTIYGEGIYMPPKFDFGIDDSKFTYGPKQSKTSESDVKTNNLDSSESNSIEETLESVSKLVESKPKVVSKPKVWYDALIIEEYESDNDDAYVFKASVEQEKPSCAFINTVKHVKTPSLSHLIRDYDLHEKRMAKQVKLNKSKNKATSILTETSKIPVNAARQNFSSQAASTSTVRKVNTTRPIVNEIRPRNNVYKSHSPIRRPFNRTTAPQANFANHKVNTVRDKTKGIKREYSNAKTPQQNGVAERKNITLIEATRTMLADSFLPNIFRAEAVSTTCYVLNRVLMTKPQNKTPYKLITGKIPIISYIRPFGCHVAILNAIDRLGKFEENFDEGFLVGYSLNSKAFRVYNLETKKVKENLHINFLENKTNVAGKGPTWMFNLDYLIDSMNYQPVTAENKANKTADPKEANNSTEANNGDENLIRDTCSKTHEEPVDQEDRAFLEELESLKRQAKEADDAAKTLRKTFAKSTKDLLLQVGAARASSTNYVNTASISVNTASPSRNIPSLEDIYAVPNDRIFTSASYDDEGVVADFTYLETTLNVSLIPQSRIHSIHPTTQILRDPTSAVYTRSKHCLFACFFSPIEPKKISQALEGKSWVDAMQEELLIKKDERGVVVRNKARLVAHGHRQEEGMDYDEIFSHVARTEAIRIFLALASYMGFIVYQMDVKSAFLYRKINKDVHVS